MLLLKSCTSSNSCYEYNSQIQVAHISLGDHTTVYILVSNHVK